MNSSWYLARENAATGRCRVRYFVIAAGLALGVAEVGCSKPSGDATPGGTASGASGGKLTASGAGGAAANVSAQSELDLSLEKDRTALLRRYVAGTLKAAEDAVAGKKGKDDACQGKNVCHWSLTEDLPTVKGSRTAGMSKTARFGVSYDKSNPKRFTVHASLPMHASWGELFSCKLVPQSIELLTQERPGVRTRSCRLSGGPNAGAVLSLSAIRAGGTATLTLTSRERS